MKIVNIIGGLGNQMFQYALVVALEQKFGQPVYVDTSLFDTYRVHNGLEIERIFGIRLKRAPESELRRLTLHTKYYFIWRIYRKLQLVKKTVCIEAKDASFDNSILSLDTDRYYDGYWQNSAYFECYADSIRKLYRFVQPLDEKNKQLYDDIVATEHSVSIHVRRGDYLKSSIYTGICTVEYYTKAIDYILQHIDGAIRFYIFSDDITWCKDNIGNLLNGYDCVYVDWNRGFDSYKDMQLMSACRHNIIANSSFSWWAAWLNISTDNIVIAPSRWQNTEYNNHIQKQEWILM